MKNFVVVIFVAFIAANCFAEWQRQDLSDSVYILFDSETSTAVVKGKGEVPALPKGEVLPFILEAKNVIVTEGITSIGSRALSGTGGDGVTNILFEAGVTNLFEEAIASHFKLASLTLPETLEIIGDRAICNSPCLLKLTIPESVRMIAKTAFEYSSLKTVTYLGERCTYAGPLNNLVSMVYIQPGANIDSFNFYYSKPKTQLVTLKTEIENDGVYVVCNASKPYAGDLVLPETWEVNGIKYPVRGIRANAFKGCTGMTSIRIPASVTLIGSQAFSGCTSLKYIKFLGDRPSSERDSFCGVKAIIYRKDSARGWDKASKTWGGAVGLYYHKFGPVEFVMGIAGDGDDKYACVLPNESFEIAGDVKIPSVCVVDGVVYPVREISDGAFANCKNVTSVLVPASIQKIGSRAFYGCSGLEYIRFAGNRPEIFNETSFEDVTAKVCYLPSKRGWANAESVWSVATGLTFAPFDGIPTNLLELEMAVGGIDETGRIELSPKGSFSDWRTDLEIPSGKSITIDLSGQQLRIGSMTVNGNLSLVDTSDSKAGWISCELGGVLGENGNLSFETSRTVKSLEDIEEVLSMNRIGASVIALMGADMQPTRTIVVPEGELLVLDLNGHVLRGALSAEGMVELRDTSKEKCGYICGQIVRMTGGSVSWDIHGNIANVSNVSELNYVAQMNAMGADISARLVSDIDQDKYSHVLAPEGASLTIFTDDHWIMGSVELIGGIHLVQPEFNKYMGGIKGRISCKEGAWIDGRIVRHVTNAGSNVDAVSSDVEVGFEGSMALVRAGATVSVLLDSDVEDDFEIPEGHSLDINLCGHSLSGHIAVNGILRVTDEPDLDSAGTLVSELAVGSKGKVERLSSCSVRSVEDLRFELSLVHDEGVSIRFSENMTCDELVIPEGAVQTIDLNGYSLTCKTLKVLGALTLIDSKGSDGFVKADRTLLGRKGSMKIDYGPVRTTYTYLNPGLVLMVR